MRVPRTFAFVDLSGFTKFTADHGDDAAARLLADFRAITRRITSNRGVRIAKWLGDGCMIVGVEPTSTIAAVLELAQCASEECAPLSVRAGIASGYALLFEGDDYIGSAVNLAARLCDVAAPLEVLMPADHVDELPDGVEAKPHDPVPIPGFAEPVALVRLEGTPGPPDGRDTGELWTRAPYVG